MSITHHTAGFAYDAMSLWAICSSLAATIISYMPRRRRFAFLCKWTFFRHCGTNYYTCRNSFYFNCAKTLLHLLELLHLWFIITIFQIVALVGPTRCSQSIHRPELLYFSFLGVLWDTQVQYVIMTCLRFWSRAHT